MGIERWTYLGPYAELPLTLKTSRRDLCPKPRECPNPTAGPFCSVCGIQVAKRFHEFQATDPPLPDVLWKELNEAMFCADGMSGPQRLDANHVVYRVIGNVARDGQPRDFNVGDGDVWVDLTMIDMKGEIAWFKKAFAPELSKLQNIYGGFHIKWGFLQWFH